MYNIEKYLSFQNMNISFIEIIIFHNCNKNTTSYMKVIISLKFEHYFELQHIYIVERIITCR